VIFNLQAPLLSQLDLLESIREELMIQKNLEKRRPELIRTIAPEAARQDHVFKWRQVIVMQPFSILDPTVSWTQPEIPDNNFPPQYEQSLQKIAGPYGPTSLTVSI
jgi:hypothetical protein